MTGGNEENKASAFGSKKPSSFDPLSPYYLSPQDHPSLVITPTVLRGDNYDEWKKAIRNSFRAKKKLVFLDGMVTRPDEDDPDMEDWSSVNSMLVVWLMNNIDPTLRSSISYKESVKDLWDDIQEQFDAGNDMRIYQLKAELANCKQAGMRISAYYGKLKHMWEELFGYAKKSICTCRGCTCGEAKELMQEREKEKVFQFLMGLDAELYGTVRSTLLGTSPLPSVNKAYSQIQQEERHKDVARNQHERIDAVGFAVNVTNRRQPPNVAVKKESGETSCTHCGKTGHDSASCFQLIGYPEWWSSGKGGGRGSTSTRGGCVGGTSRGRGVG